MKNKYAKAAIIVLCILIAVSSVYAGRVLSNPGTQRQAERIASLDAKAETVLKLTAASTAASAGISALPGDTATPIAEKLADFAEYFLFILTTLYAEKYLLTILAGTAFKFVIPFACALFIVSVFYRPEILGRIGLKLSLLALAIYITIPLGIGVSDMINATYNESISATLSAAEAFTDEAEQAAGEEESGVVSNLFERVSDKAAGLIDSAASVLNRFIEALAVMIVTTCVIPLLILVLFLWIIRVFTGAAIPMPRTVLPTRRARRALK